MNSLKKVGSWAAVLALSSVIAACATPFHNACLDPATNPVDEWKYTKVKSLIACSDAALAADGAPVKMGKNGGRVFNPSALKVVDVRKVIEDQLAGIDKTLRYTNPDLLREVESLRNFRSELEREEGVIAEKNRLISFADALGTFVQKVGPLPDDVMDATATKYFFPNGTFEQYSIRLFYKHPDHALDGIPLVAKYLESAKAEQKLQLVETFEYVGTQELGKKIPRLRDSNEYDWKADSRGLVIKGYKIIQPGVKPDDNSIHYLEIYFKRPGTNLVESLPAARGFLPQNGSNVSFFLVSFRHEGEYGYGTPDVVLETSVPIRTAKDVFTNETLRAKFFDEELPAYFVKNRPERTKPPESPFYAKVVPIREKIQSENWQIGKWTVAVDYKKLPQDLVVQFAPPSAPVADPENDPKQIMYFKREFKREGRRVVVEYWIPKDEFAAGNIMRTNTWGKEFEVGRKDQPTMKGEVGYFAKRIKHIDYLLGDQWHRVVDEDGDGVFEKKRTIGEPGDMETHHHAPAALDYGGF